MMKPSWLAAILAAATVTACERPADAHVDTRPVGLPNPAAVFCEEQGGEFLLDSGECRLADGQLVDAWDYFREHHPDHTGGE